MVPVALILLAAAPELLGPPLRQDGYTFKPPQGFRMGRMELFHGTRAGAITDRAEAQRWLSAALIDGEGEDAASLLVSIVERPFVAGPGTRDELSVATVRHFADALGMKLQLERVSLPTGAPERIELFGAMRQGSQLRNVEVVAFTGRPRHVVLIASAPSGRFGLLQPALAASIESFRFDAPALTDTPRTIAAAAALILLAALTFSVGLWRSVRARKAGNS
jgi:hypothetical protein